jgi:carbamoylphosphate synthase small subunit
VKRLQIRGAIPEFVTDNTAFEIVVNSAVKRGIALSEIQRDIQLLQLVAQLGGEAAMNIDTAKLARKILRDGDMSPEVIRTESDVAEMQEQMQQQAQISQVAEQVLKSQTEN